MSAYKFIARNTNNETTIILVKAWEAKCDKEAWEVALRKALGKYGAFLDGVELLDKSRQD